MRTKIPSVEWIFLLAMLTGIGLLAACHKDDDTPTDPVTPPDCVVDESYQPVIDPANFVSSITTPNPLYPLVPGTVFLYEGLTADGAEEHVSVTVTSGTYQIMGVTCVVVLDSVFTGEEATEITTDWYAQDLAGNVWYFGEAAADNENGVLTSTAGSWEAGVDGALPGIVMPANPFPAQVYRQEYYACEAEDMAQVLALGQSLKVPFGSFANCVKTREWTPLEPGVTEEKWYVPGVGFIRSMHLDSPAFTELVEIQQ